MTETLPDNVEPYRNISAKAYEHPTDRAATAALQAVPMLDTVVRKLIEWRYERALRQFYLGNSVKVGERQLPELWAGHVGMCKMLDMPDVYDLYVTSGVPGGASAIGAQNPMIVFDTALLQNLGPGEQRVVIAHELGHILSDHMIYVTALNILLSVGNGLPFFLGIPFRAVKAVLLEWFRATELSCDRAATLAVRDPQIVCRTLMVTAGGMHADKLNLDAFMTQAMEYESWDDPSDRARRFFNEIGQTHTLRGPPRVRGDEVGPVRRVRPDRPRRVPHPRPGVRRPPGGQRGDGLLRRAVPVLLPRGRRQRHQPRFAAGRHEPAGGGLGPGARWRPGGSGGSGGSGGRGARAVRRAQAVRGAQAVRARAVRPARGMAR